LKYQHDVYFNNVIVVNHCTNSSHK